MRAVQVHASKHYDVLIGSGLLKQLGEFTARVTQAGKAAIVTDSNIAPLYLESAAQSLKNAGFSVAAYVFPAGEASKNGETYLSLLSFLAKNQLTRADCIVALGGGVAGDLAGFAASTYLRGISYVQVPTTLLSAVDSSVGGKTAIDLPEGKNLAGSFYQPSLVLCDTDLLDSLPEAVFRDGCAEVIKYAVLFDAELFSYLQETGLSFHREAVIARCVELKRDVVAKDEFDRGQRQLLNLGHTVGHAVEALSAFTISHGSAVAIGMAIVSRASCRAGFCSAQTRDAVCSLLHRFSLPAAVTFSPALLSSAALSDKKRSGGTIQLIVPQAIGQCRLLPMPVENLEAFITLGV